LFSARGWAWFKSWESNRVPDYTPYQRKIIDRYYKNFDAIKFQRLSELATDLYLAEGKKLDRLWAQVESGLRKLEVPGARIAELVRRRDPAMLVAILKDIERGS
jgi:hypothetical protein